MAAAARNGSQPTCRTQRSTPVVVQNSSIDVEGTRKAVREENRGPRFLPSLRAASRGIHVVLVTIAVAYQRCECGGS